MKLHSQSGLAHLTTIALAVVVLGLVSFSAYRIGVANSDDTVNQEQSEQSDVELAEGIKINEEKEDAKKEVDIPAEEKIADTAPVPEPVKEEVQKVEDEKPAEEKKDKVWLEMQKVSAAQDGSVVNVSSRLPQALSGTCHFKLWQDGYERVYSSTQISNSTDCTGQINVANMVTYDGWELHVWFDADDGKTHGYQTDEPFPLTNPN